jgi:hypothetical protein
MKMSEFEVGVWYTTPDLTCNVKTDGRLLFCNRGLKFVPDMADITRDDWEPVERPKVDLCADESHMFVGVRCTRCGKEYGSAIGNTIRSCPCGGLYFTLFDLKSADRSEYPKPDPCDEAWDKDSRHQVFAPKHLWCGNGSQDSCERWFRRGFKLGRESN